MSTLALINKLKEADQDFEWYPTTTEILNKLIDNVRRYVANEFDKRNDWRAKDVHSVMDIGAGNGKVLRALGAAPRELAREDRGKLMSEFYAIEKSPILCQQLDPNVFIVGTDFMAQELMSKQVGMIFCNPPYKQFAEWSIKIIREAAASVVYLVIPQRWQANTDIANALKYRGAEAVIVGEFSFEDAEDRKARAKVHLLRIELSTDKDDAFERFFNEQFAGLKERFRGKQARENEEDEDKPTKEETDAKKFAGLVVGPSYPDRLVELYNREMDVIRKNYDAVAGLDADLMREFEVTPAKIMACLKARLSGTKNTYWNELFANMKQVTDRLTSKKRRLLMETLLANGHVDFTVDNIHVVVLWVLKNANQYLDTQLIETFGQMVEKANVRNYISNQKPFTHDRWRYNEEKPTHIALEYRLVLERIGGIKRGYSFERGLDENAANFFGDLLTVARNLGFHCETNDLRLTRQSRDGWTSGTLEHFMLDSGKVLFEVRAYQNGNCHIRLNQEFALALNVEYGRLRGWLKSAQDAKDELKSGDKQNDALVDKLAVRFFGSHVQLGQSSLPMLGAPKPEEVPEAIAGDQQELAMEGVA